MKVGDKIPVEIQGITVAYAEVNEIKSDEVGLTIPGTYVRMGVATSLTSGPEPTPEVDVRLENGGRVDSGSAVTLEPGEQVVPTTVALDPAPSEKPSEAPSTDQTNSNSTDTQE